MVAFLEAHPGAKVFVETPKPIPTSYARQAYFAVTAFKDDGHGHQVDAGAGKLRAVEQVFLVALFARAPTARPAASMRGR